MENTPRRRNYRPSGKPIDDGRNLYHAYVRVDPWVLEYVKLYAKDHQTSDAQAVGDFLTAAVQNYGLSLSPGTEHHTAHMSRLEFAYQSQRTKPVRPTRKASQETEPS